MSVAIRITEGVPATYPDAPPGLSTAAAALDGEMIWQRLEAYIAWRYSQRTIEWVVEGCGDWRPPLAPATIATTERWDGEAWQPVTLSASPTGGYQLRGVGPYRFAGTVGVDDSTVPAGVLEAFRRMAEYMAVIDFETAGLRTEGVQDVWQGEYASPSWRARALQDSGAADLLRSFRRA